MITTAELHRIAAREGLRFDQAEKDCIILLVLSALSPILAENNPWYFKGGTCLRHCYYPGYRFFEDIDFSCAKTEGDIRPVYEIIDQAAGAISEKTGIMLKCKEPKVTEDMAQVEIPVEYSRGGFRRQALPAIKVHLSLKEPLLAEPEMVLVQAPADLELPPFSLAAYGKIEIVAEKLRALLQQQEKWPRPRDLYDLWFITCFKGEEFDRNRLRTLFEKKCRIRGVAADIGRLRSEQLYDWNREAWKNQLLPMLRTAPDYNLVWSEWSAKCEDLL